ncbi:hypothetical protein GWK47_054312 [Chionoecetes opilio]|uniref:Uncharacterized protein n=1 Tax=Chionoecetes opilio TaxID=41210 RepID=A0A8J4Y557_CHIOP|nr:hypothetical protein GWK47_054312 [Chionoecetes opilio]
MTTISSKALSFPVCHHDITELSRLQGGAALRGAPGGVGELGAWCQTLHDDGQRSSHLLPFMLDLMEDQMEHQPDERPSLLKRCIESLSCCHKRLTATNECANYTFGAAMGSSL